MIAAPSPIGISALVNKSHVRSIIVIKHIQFGAALICDVSHRSRLPREHPYCGHRLPRLSDQEMVRPASTSNVKEMGREGAELRDAGDLPLARTGARCVRRPSDIWWFKIGDMQRSSKPYSAGCKSLL
jgi:hypothetical protein